MAEMQPSGHWPQGLAYDTRAPGEQRRANELLRLAAVEFGPAMAAQDRLVVACAALGEYAECADQEIDPRVVRWLLTDREAEPLVHATGVRVFDGVFASLLDLESTVCRRELLLRACTLQAGVNLRLAKTKSLFLQRCQISSRPIPGSSRFMALNGQSLHVQVSLFLRGEGFHARGEVRLVAARVEGIFDCNGGRFENEGDTALNLDQATVVGTAFLGAGAVGTARVPPPTFNGRVDLRNAELGVLSDTETRWPDAVLLQGCVYGSIQAESGLSAAKRPRWLAKSDRGISPPKKLDPQPYRQCAKVLREHGHEQDARDVLRVGARRRRWRDFEIARPRLAAWWGPQIRRLRTWGGRAEMVRAEPEQVKARCEQIRQRWGRGGAVLRCVLRTVFFLPLALLRWFFFDLMLGYGYARWRVLACIGAFWLAGAWQFGAFAEKPGYPLGALVEHPVLRPEQSYALKSATIAAEWLREGGAVEDLSAEHRWIEKYPKPNAWIYSADALIPLVSFHQEEYWTPRSGRVKTYYLPVHIASGWIIATLFAASFTRIVREERGGG